MQERNPQLVSFVEGAVIAAIALGLSFIPINAPNAAFDLSLGLIPLAVYAVRRGLLPAIAVGAVWGLLNIVVGRAFMISIPQVIFEYPFAFAFGGMFGIFAARIRSGLAIPNSAATDSAGTSGRRRGGAIRWIVLASIIAALSRWFWHFIAGGIIWAEYAPEGTNPWIYSLIMNGLSFIGNTVMMIIAITALSQTAPRLFRA
jgi:thiamine transporter